MSRLTRFALLLISLAAALALWHATPAGLGLTNDSAAYIGGARSILAGTGYSDIWLDSSLEPITHYPPLLSLTLSGLGLLGLDPLRGARLLNIILFGANTGLMGLLGWRMTRSQPAALLLALLFALNATLLRLHAYALSEPLFLFFSLLSFLFVDISVESQKSKATHTWLWFTGFLTAAAFLTRYSGLALIATFFVAIFFINSTWHSRWTKSTQFISGTIPLIAVWIIRNSLIAGNATNRTFQYHPLQLENVRIGLRNVANFLVPFEAWQRGLFKSGAVTWLLVIIGLILLIWLAITTWKLLFQPANRQSTPAPNPLVFTTATYIFAYIGAILFSMSFFDASTKFQHRILAPLYVSGLILCVYGLKSLTMKDTKLTKEISSKTFVLFVTFVVSFLALGLAAFDFRQTAIELRDASGLGYGSWKWRDSVVIADLKKLPTEVAIYTNSPPAVYLVTGRPSRVLPTPIDPVDNLPRGNYEQDVAQMRAEILSGQAVLALFDTSNIEDALGAANVDQFTSGLVVLEKAQGDVLYGKP